MCSESCIEWLCIVNPVLSGYVVNPVLSGYV